jgi:hypothetical protein
MIGFTPKEIDLMPESEQVLHLSYLVTEGVGDDVDNDLVLRDIRIEDADPEANPYDYDRDPDEEPYYIDENCED